MSTSEGGPARGATGTPGASTPRDPRSGRFKPRTEPRSWIDAVDEPEVMSPVAGHQVSDDPGGTVRPAEPAKAPATERSAFLMVTRVDPWSVMKLSFLVSVALAIVVVVAAFVLWQVLDGMGVFDSVSRIVNQVTRGEEGGGIQIEDYVGLRQVLTYTALLSAVNVVLITALATLGAFLYNACARLVGGLQITLAEDA